MPHALSPLLYKEKKENRIKFKSRQKGATFISCFLYLLFLDERVLGSFSGELVIENPFFSFT